MTCPRREAQADERPTICDEIVKIKLGIDAAKSASLPQPSMAVENVFRAWRTRHLKDIVF
jgi:hypothetical protein